MENKNNPTNGMATLYIFNLVVSEAARLLGSILCFLIRS